LQNGGPIGGGCGIKASSEVGKLPRNALRAVEHQHLLALAITEHACDRDRDDDAGYQQQKYPAAHGLEERAHAQLLATVAHSM
jgi:hypothetical protein